MTLTPPQLSPYSGLRSILPWLIPVTAMSWVLSLEGSWFSPLNGGLLLTGLAGIFFWVRRGVPVGENGPDNGKDWIWLWLPPAYFCLGVVTNTWFYFTGWAPGGEKSAFLLKPWLFRSLAISLLILLLWRKWPGLFSRRLCRGLFFVSAGLFLLALASVTGFEPIYRVDHPSFYYRLHSFVEAFPHPGFYDPNWNAGQPVPYLVASGVWALALPWYPLLRLIPLEFLYTPMIAVTFLLLVPGSGYAACRLFGGSARAGWICALLFLAPGQRYFVHLLHYGTTPSILCLSLSPLLLALLWRLLHADTPGQHARRSLPLLAVAGLILCWPGSLLMGLPVAAALLAVFSLWTPRRLLWLGIIGGALVLLLHPLALVSLRYSPLDAFFRSYESLSFQEHFLKGARLLADQVQAIHPLIPTLGLAGFVRDPNRPRARMIGTFCVTALLAAGWGEEFSPLLQWERLIIPAVLVGALLCACQLDHLLTWVAESTASRLGSRNQRAFATTLLAWMLSLLLLGLYQGARIYQNRGLMKFHTLPAHTRELIDWLREEVPVAGRVLFAGPAVHGFGGAKVAAMPLWIDREMMACDYYGFSPSLVEQQYPPRQVLNQGPEGVYRFLRMHNVSHVISRNDGWKQALERQPQWYRPAFSLGQVGVYAVDQTDGLLAGASGSVRAKINRIEIDLEADPPDTLLLKYNWAAGWQVQPPARLFPQPQEFGITFIGIRPNGVRNLVLEFEP